MTPARLRDYEPPFGTVVFDCDSTLSTIEGIDELCGIVGVAAGDVAELTTRAMAGELALEEVYARRLELLRPDAAALETLGERYVATHLPHAPELCAGLAALGKRVFIVSGGLRQPVLRLARHLGIPADHVFAVEAFLDRTGQYAGFDELSPLARSGGKLDVLREIARSDTGGGVVLVGDGVTDLEAAPTVRRFVAFGGVVRRAPVFDAASVTTTFPDLARLLPLLTAPDELERLSDDPDHAPLLSASRHALPRP